MSQNKLKLNQTYNTDALTGCKSLPDNSINCCVTSPPYYGLRDYGVKNQLGLEVTPYKYIEKLVAIFREVKRALTPDGTLWIVIGDSYAGSSKGRNGDGVINKHVKEYAQKSNEGSTMGILKPFSDDAIKPKDLMGIPWMLAFALRDDGWYLRQDIIWAKPNPMPESVADRCTRSHEYIFMLTKSKAYYYDNEAIKEPSVDAESYKPKRKRNATQMANKDPKNFKFGVNAEGVLKATGKMYPTHNKRDVWTQTTRSNKYAHFAVFPPELIEPCILAGCPSNGIVLDPFMGSGTTALVAHQHERYSLGFEINPEYCEIIKNRTR